MRVFAWMALAASLLTLGGCYFDNPLTGGSTKEINTWLLGVWEHRDEDGRVARAQVTPISDSRYFVEFARPGKTARDVKKYEFEAWPSRVGDTVFLTLKCLTSPGDIPTGAHVFVQAQLLDQNNVRLRSLQLDLPPTATSFELRREVRQKLKDRSLYKPETTDWKRVAEVFWSTDGQDPAFKPIRSPTY